MSPIEEKPMTRDELRQMLAAMNRHQRRIYWSQVKAKVKQRQKEQSHESR
jgi:hypothetical protein